MLVCHMCVNAADDHNVSTISYCVFINSVLFFSVIHHLMEYWKCTSIWLFKIWPHRYAHINHAKILCWQHPLYIGRPGNVWTHENPSCHCIGWLIFIRSIVISFIKCFYSSKNKMYSSSFVICELPFVNKHPIHEWNYACLSFCVCYYKCEIAVHTFINTNVKIRKTLLNTCFHSPIIAVLVCCHWRKND